MTNLSILYEDNHLIVVNKQSGQLSQGDKTGDASLIDIVKSYIKEKYNKPGNVYLGLPHRIDRPTSGILMFAKTSKALSRLNELFKKREVQKTYWAVVGNQPPKFEDTLVHYLWKNQRKNQSIAKKEVFKDGLKSELSYRVLAESDRYYLLEIHPKTGRHHQIRVQLSTIGCPIKGDVKYGFKRPNEDKSIHLHARQISFIHPIKKEKIIITAPPPQEKVWQILAQSIH